LKDTLALVQSIQTGATSRLRQRAVYDARFAPSVVAKIWFDYLDTPPLSG